MPQMKALAERIAAVTRGERLQRCDILHFAALKTVAPSPETLSGSILNSVTTRGKFLVMTFSEGQLMIHLSQAGRINFEPVGKTTRPKGAAARLTFDSTAFLLKEFGTERKVALWICKPDDLGPLAQLGPECDSEEFRAWLVSTDDPRRIHTLLRDQRTVAGIGRGYSDDALHHAKISPLARLPKLGEDERSRLFSSLQTVMSDGLAFERARKNGLPPKLSDHWLVHGKWGEQCPSCGDDLRRVSYASHEITYCPKCQTNSKVLADRRLSRIVK